MSLFLTKLTDRFLGSILIVLLSIFKFKRKLPKSPKSFLFIQLWGVGESILTLPAMSHLRNHFPNAKIDVLCTSKNIACYKRFSDVDSVLLIQPNLFQVSSFILGCIFGSYSRYDVVIDMEEYLNISSVMALFSGRRTIGFAHGVRSLLFDAKVVFSDKQHMVKSFEDLLTPLEIFDRAAELPSLKFPSSALDSVLAKLNDLGVGENFFIVVPPVAESGKARMWNFKKYSKLADMLIEKYDIPCLVTGLPQDKDLCESVSRVNALCFNTAGLFSLDEFFALTRLAKLIVSNDTGSMHIGAAQKTPTIGLFGPNLPVRFGPFGSNNLSIYKENACPFSPCINVHKGEVPDCLYPKDSFNYSKCMKAISVEEVFESACSVLDKSLLKN